MADTMRRGAEMVKNYFRRALTDDFFACPVTQKGRRSKSVRPSICSTRPYRQSAYCSTFPPTASVCW